MDIRQKRAILYISIFTGFLSFIILQVLQVFLPIPMEFRYLFPLLFAVGIWSIMPTVLYLEDRKYKKIEEKFESEILLKTNGNLITDKGQRNGNIYLENDKLHFISLNKRPHVFIELKKGQLLKIELKNFFDLEIVIDNEVRIYLRTVDAEQLLIKMIEKGFI
ncbi:MAG: hypothetical protein PHQ32_05405 [Firmicutes bacterium]|nr:hypothetical protein [Bacillota bacterium]